MAFINKSDTLNFEFWFEPEFIGEQWGIGVHDIDGNGYLDFYANHHGQASGEIIMNFGSANPTNIYYEIPGDLHGVSFFDVDQDGDADLMQGQGGRRGNATNPNDVTLYNKVLLNEGGSFSYTNSAGDLGLGYSLGRKRILTPVNFDGDLAIYVGVLDDRPDGTYPGDFFGRTGSGRYSLIEPFGDLVNGELAKGVHFGNDRFVDIINFDWKEREVRVFENKGDGFGQMRQLNTTGAQVTDVVTGDFDGDLRSEILFGRAGRRDALFRQDANGNWVDISAASMPGFVKTTHGIALGDFDNDGDLDYAALKRQDGVEVQTYLNRGNGTFFVGPRFFDAGIPGRGDFMITGDFNRDGALDLMITTSGSIEGGQGSLGGVYVLLEGEPTQNNWLSIELKGRASETGGLGARVYVTTPDGKVQVREQDSGVHFMSQNSTDLHFGLGSANSANVRIVWPDGYEQRINGLAVNRHVVLTEDRESPGDPWQPTGPDIVGSAINDTLYGTTARERMFGENGDDWMTAAAGDDRLFGGNGNDRLFGGAGDDLLEGGEGDDRLRGQAGDDVLRGGAGADVLIGGPGRDVFEFLAVEDSRPDARDSLQVVPQDGGAAFDLPGSGFGDRFDLSALDGDETAAGRQAFEFGGTTQMGKGFIWLVNVGANTYLRGNTDNDAAPEFEVEIQDGSSVQASDYTRADFFL